MLLGFLKKLGHPHPHAQPLRCHGDTPVFIWGQVFPPDSYTLTYQPNVYVSHPPCDTLPTEINDCLPVTLYLLKLIIVSLGHSIF